MVSTWAQSPVLICAICLIIFTAGLLWSEVGQDARLKFVFKPLASLSFIGLALACGALYNFYGYFILAGLAFCALGDVFLLPSGTGKYFRAGVSAFLIGHIFYILASIALWSPDVLRSQIILGLPFLICLLVPVYQRIYPRADAQTDVYTGVIILMITAMLLCAVKTGIWILPTAAIMFAVSDIFVSRNRFGPPSPKQFWMITPLYFTAQGLFAYSVSYA